MKKLLIVYSLIVSILFISGCAPRAVIKPGYDFSKIRRIAVMGFEGYGGEGLSDLFVLELLKSGFDVVERNQLENLIKEQNLSSSGRLESETVKNIGKLFGVDAIVAGSVNRYLPAQRKAVYFAAGEIPVVIPGLFILEKSENYILYQVDAEIGISARMIDVETGSIVWIASDSYRAFTTDYALQGVVFSLVNSLKSAFPK